MNLPRGTFLLQVLVSAVPTVLSIAFIPALGKNLGLSTALIGLAFFVYRAGGICGNLVTPRLLKRFYPDKLCALLEFLMAVTTFAIVWAVDSTWVHGFIALIAVKGFISSVVVTSRVSWLRNFPDIAASNGVNLMANTTLNAAYGVAGVILLLAPNDFAIAKQVYLLDGVSSVVGALLFLKAGAVAETKVTNVSTLASTSLLLKPGRAALFAQDFFMAAALAGTNILLVKFGENQFSNFGGYGSSLILYAVFFVAGGMILKHVFDHTKKQSKLRTLPSLGVALGFGMLMVTETTAMHGLAFCIVLLSYAVFLLEIQMRWFAICLADEAAKVFALRTVLLAVVLAVGEWFYSQTAFDIKIRLGFASVATLIAIKSLKSKSETLVQV